MPGRDRPVSIVLTAGALVAAFVVAMLTTSGIRVGTLTVFGLWYGGMVIAASGLTLIRWAARDAVDAVLSLSVLVGSAVTSIFLMVACVLTGKTAGTLFVWWSVLVACAWWWRSGTARRGEHVDGREVLAIVALSLLVAVWCHPAASVLPSIHASGTVPVWSDYFIHATEVAQFGDPRAAGHASFLLANQPLLLYHYASFMLPAVSLAVVNAPALAVAASVLLPYGLLLALLGAYAFVRAVQDRAGTSGTAALVAAAALVLIPDASAMGLRNGFFGFHWLLFTAPGSGYAIGLAFAAAAFVAIGKARNDLGSLLLAGGLMLALFEFRAHVFLLFVPAMAMTMLWDTAIVQRHTRLVGMAMALTIAAVAAAIFLMSPLRHAWLDFSVSGTFLNIAHSQTPTGYDGVYQALEQRYGPAIVWIVGVALLLPAALGALTLALPAARYVATRATGVHALDSLPYWGLAVWIGLVAFAPKASHGDYTEYQHRPFVCLYAIWMVWTVIYLHRASSLLPQGLGRRVLATMTIVALCAAGVPALRDNPARPHFDGGMRYFGNTIDPDLVQAARFVRAQATPGDIFALLPTEPWATLDDAATRFASISNTPAYLARPGIQRKNGEPRAIAVEQRIAELNGIESAPDADAALARVRAIGVRFLIVVGERSPRFDPDHARAVFGHRTVAVYDTR